MELEPTSITQVLRLRDGRMCAVEDDVLGIVRELRAIDPGIVVEWSEAQELFVLFTRRDGKEKLIRAVPELDMRIVERIRQVAHHSYDYGAELDRIDREAQAEADRRFRERVGEAGERLHHAIRHDLGFHTDRAFIGEQP